MDLARLSRSLKFSILVVLCMLMICGGRELRTGTHGHKHHGEVYNRTLAKILVEYASAVYMNDLNSLISWTCSRCNGLTKRFQMVELIVDVQHCLQVMAGLQPCYEQTISLHIASYPEEICIPKKLVNHGAKDVQVVTYGQPRVGNLVFSAYYNALVPKTIRVTHGHDIVPHLPPYYTFFPQRTYHHFPREVWIYNLGLGSLVYEVEKICDSSGEDPSCSRSVSGNSITDHLEYYGVSLQAESWGSCGWVWQDNELSRNDDKVDIDDISPEDLTSLDTLAGANGADSAVW